MLESVEKGQGGATWTTWAKPLSAWSGEDPFLERYLVEDRPVTFSKRASSSDPGTPIGESFLPGPSLPDLSDSSRYHLGLTVSLVTAIVGATTCAASGAIIGSMNAGWFGLERNANALLPVLGIGAALVVIAFAPSGLRRRLAETARLGRGTEILLVVGPTFLVLSWVVEFAILGTLAFGIGLVCLAVAVTRETLVPATDRALIILSAIGSLTWNTETVSAFLLVGVGLIWLILSIRLLPTSRVETG